VNAPRPVAPGARGCLSATGLSWPVAPEYGALEEFRHE
jgi:hypothetical protein